jgi:hypothetical protein
MADTSQSDLGFWGLGGQAGRLSTLAAYRGSERQQRRRQRFIFVGSLEK